MANLQQKRLKILAHVEEMKKNDRTCSERIETRKEEPVREITQEFEKLTKKLRHQGETINKQLHEKIASIDDNIALLESIKEHTNNDTISAEEIAESRETVESIAQFASSNLSGSRKYEVLDYQEGAHTSAVNVGYLTKKRLSLELPDITEPTPDYELCASQFECTGNYDFYSLLNRGFQNKVRSETIYTTEINHSYAVGKIRF